jgi:hypothetical protein
MGLFTLLKMEGKDIAAFVLAGLFGYLVGSLIHEESWAVYTSILVSYHLFLGWLVLTADREPGFSLPVVSTILTHLACLALILTLGMGHNLVPFFGILRFGIAGLAIFECRWLFSGKA